MKTETVTMQLTSEEAELIRQRREQQAAEADLEARAKRREEAARERAQAEAQRKYPGASWDDETVDAAVAEVRAEYEREAARYARALELNGPRGVVGLPEPKRPTEPELLDLALTWLARREAEQRTAKMLEEARIAAEARAAQAQRAREMLSPEALSARIAELERLSRRREN